jgi:hypothetical protein
MAEFKLIKNKIELKGTCYFEFLPGKYKDKCWNDNSVFISEDAIYVIEDLLKETNENYDHYSFVHYNKKQMKMLEEKFMKRLSEMKNDVSYKIIGTYFNEEYYNELNKDIKKNRDEIIKMLEELFLWIESVKENEITILGM